MDNQFEFLVYRTAEEDISINAVVKDETIWLTQKAMGELFGVDKSSISRHLKNIFAEGELQEEVVVAKFATTISRTGCDEGKTQTKDTQFYNLDALFLSAIASTPHPRNAVPYLGHRRFEGVHDKGLCVER